jgi:lysyl-tRNA synthetase class 2
MKQVLSVGCHRIFQIGPCFRNKGELGPWHHPEFTMIEWYRCGISWQDFMVETFELIRHCVKTFGKEAKFEVPQDLPTFSIKNAFEKFAGIELVDEDAELAGKAQAAGVLSIRGDEDFDTAFFKILLEKIEPALAHYPLSVLYDYPASQAALAAVEGDVARRFEFFASGIELSNAFFELAGMEANAKRISTASARRKILGLPEVPVDEDFIAAMGREFPPCAGNAMGFDRLLACILGLTDISALVPFKHARIWKQHEIP